MLITSATQLVLKAHKEAVDSLSGNGSAKLGTVATVVAAANSTALECSKEIEAAMQISLRNALGMMNNRTTDGPMDDKTILKVYNFQNFSFLFFCCYITIFVQIKGNMLSMLYRYSKLVAFCYFLEPKL